MSKIDLTLKISHGFFTTTIQRNVSFILAYFYTLIYLLLPLDYGISVD